MNSKFLRFSIMLFFVSWCFVPATQAAPGEVLGKMFTDIIINQCKKLEEIKANGIKNDNFDEIHNLLMAKNFNVAKTVDAVISPLMPISKMINDKTFTQDDSFAEKIKDACEAVLANLFFALQTDYKKIRGGWFVHPFKKAFTKKILRLFESMKLLYSIGSLKMDNEAEKENAQEALKNYDNIFFYIFLGIDAFVAVGIQEAKKIQSNKKNREKVELDKQTLHQPTLREQLIQNEITKAFARRIRMEEWGLRAKYARGLASIAIAFALGAKGLSQISKAFAQTKEKNPDNHKEK